MLVRILSDNPGPSFTRNFDKGFVSTVKEVLRNCKDASTQQILRETLDTLEANKQYQEGMEALIAMWRKEKGQQASFAGQQRRAMPVIPAWNQGYAGGQEGQQQRPHGPSRERSSRHNTLPAPMELASRIEEARNSAKILMQLIQSTPPEEIIDNELVREFNERCQSAQRSMQGYINCENPAPDDDTMLTLIETNEQLSLSSSRYQRALLTARRALGVSPSPGQEAMMGGGIGAAVSSGGASGREPETQSAFAPPGAPPPSAQQQPYYPPPNNIPNTNMSAFASPVSSHSDEDVYTAPPGPPPPKSDRRYEQLPASPLRNGSPDTYRAPPGPPPQLLNRLNSRDETYSPPRSPPPPQTQKPSSDPFADPAEYDPNPAPGLAFEPAHYGTSSSAISPSSPTHPHRAPFDALPEEGTWSSTASSRYDQPAYSSTSPKASRRPVSSVGASEPASPERARWPSQDAVSEIDGHSEVGRSEPVASGGASGGVDAGSREERGYRY